MQAASAVVGGAGELFDYNRHNFLHDRAQRQKMEYQVADMRIKQTELWREDVRDIVELTVGKMQVYLTVIGFELGFCVTALCKARCPPGAPPWLASCHTLSMMGAFMYLFMALWLGMHAFVAAQAYRVRILTQLVRLPIPTWQGIEASRTYSSGFERMGINQILRMPFVMGQQEARVTAALGRLAAADGGVAPAASDPWGLERRGDNIAELAYDVNERTSEQRHIWLVREAAMFYQTYDGFCRIAMSLGTSSLATFFCYFCLTYVLTENAAPIAAWTGMGIFGALSLVIFRLDLLISNSRFVIGALMMFSGPAISGIVTFESSRNAGEPGEFEYLMPFALFLHGSWLLYYLFLFNVKETLGGQMLPLAFRAILFLDVFGWARHGGNWWKRLRGRGGATAAVPGRRLINGFEQDPLPAMECVDTKMPTRPEDVDNAEPVTVGPADVQSPNVRPSNSGSEEPNLRRQDSFRPGSFVGASSLQDSGSQYGDLMGENPGLLPWRVFFSSTVVLAMLWWCAAGIALSNAVQGTDVFVQPTYGLEEGVVAPLANLLTLQAWKIPTHWPSSMAHPRGLVCDESGATFVTTGRTPSGEKGLLRASLRPGNASLEVLFEPAPRCGAFESETEPIQDLSLQDCSASGEGCKTLILTAGGHRLIACDTHQGDSLEKSVSLSHAWLKTHGAFLTEPTDMGGHKHQMLSMSKDPEQIVSVTASPCNPGTDASKEHDCVIVGTSHRRMVLMSRGASGELHDLKWLPKRVFHHGDMENFGPGSISLLGGRYLATLQKTNRLRVLDLQRGGVALAGNWLLPELPDNGRFTSLCMGGGALYMVDDGDEPNLWHVKIPKSLRI